ncbi:hypothetical protein B0H34DRAFT_691393 [Crassisporium funariophilum]|nr:hypothetical protein B0H34DRAFT_691393 [Crassisporium funariophilum]
MDNKLTYPPLLGDNQGRYRVHVVGNSGSGKSTTGQELAAILGVPYINMDKIMWQPGWGTAEPEEFQAKLRALLDQDERGWVADGEFVQQGGLMAYEESTDVLWLDPPFVLYFPRLIIRTCLRLVGLRPPCAPGCPERLMDVLSRNGILWWCITNHWRNRRRQRARIQDIGLGVGSDVMRRRMRRMGGWGGDLKRWLMDVREMRESKND